MDKSSTVKLPADLLAGSALRDDARVAEAKKLILSAVADHQKKLTGVKPPVSDLVQTYDQILAQFAKYRGSKLYYPYLGSGIGKGALVELLDGSVKYDFITGIGVHYWGHSHPDIISASIDAALSNTVMQGNLQQNEDSVELHKILVESSKLDHCFMTSSGSMANENAIKIAFQKKCPASRILAFDRAFAGRTLAVSQITDKPNFREGLPSTYFVDYVPFFDHKEPEESIHRAVNVLKKHIARYPKQHALMVCELIQGEGGFYPGTHEFFSAIMTVLKENDIIVFDDEVQSFGRTSELFAFQHFGLEEYVDIVSIGKLSQFCATLFKKDLAPRPGLLSQTFTSSTSAIQAGKKIILNLLNEGYFGPNGKIMELHNYFTQKLQLIADDHPSLIKGPYGIGAMIGFTPYEGDNQRVVKLAHDLFREGIISFVAGSSPSRLRFLIPVGAITHDDIDQALKILENILIQDAS